MTAPTGSPALSVILPTPHDFDSIRATVRHLGRQTIAGRLELVVVAMGRDDFALDPEACRGFWGAQVARSGTRSHGEASVAGVRAARAPIVAFAEDHCFPDPGWAEALLRAYTTDDIAAVGPVFRNANPGTLVSWCDFAMGYGPWMAPGIGGDAAFLAGHNSSYRRDVLLGLGNRLEDLLEAETILHFELRRAGRRLVVEPRARAAHTNFGRFDVWVPVQYHCGRVFAAERARPWSWARRVFYAAASPLIPLVRLTRSLRQLARADGPRPAIARVAPVLLFGLAADGVGQLIGYLAGSGRSPGHLTGFEFGRVNFVPESERTLWQEPDGQSGSGAGESAGGVSSPTSR